MILEETEIARSLYGAQVVLELTHCDRLAPWQFTICLLVPAARLGVILLEQVIMADLDLLLSIDRHPAQLPALHVEHCPPISPAGAPAEQVRHDRAISGHEGHPDRQLVFARRPLQKGDAHTRENRSAGLRPLSCSHINIVSC